MDGTELRKLAADLVAIPSVNPLDGPIGDGKGEKEIAALIASRLQEAGVECEMREAAPDRPSVVARIDGASEEAVWFDAHIDTVSAEGMTVDPFGATIEGDLLYGRGASDDKGSVAAMMAAVMAVAKGEEKPPAAVVFTATADEEYGMLGLRGLIESGLQARAAVVGEPTGLAIATAHRGFTRFRITTSGKAVHSSRPEDGVNAIYRMSKIVQALEAYAKGGVRRKAHPLLGRGSLSVGVIRGGEYVNIVPDRCEIRVDRRLLPEEEARRAVADVREYLSNAVTEDVGLKVSGPDLTVPGTSIPLDHPLVQATAATLKSVTGQMDVGMVEYATHAGPLSEAGIPALVFGPGAKEQPHTAAEELDLNQLEQAAAVYEALMRSGCE
jgi:acetylornithine deacetylase